MTMSNSDTEPATYTVYLREQSPNPEVTSPLATDRIDYYDAGIWVHREEDRLFLPYHQIQLIREGIEPEDLTSGVE